MVLLFVEILLERQDAQQAIDVSLDVLDAMLLPSPYLWGNVIDDWDVAVLLDEACYLEVEAWIIDQDEHVWPPLKDVLLASFHALKYGP